MSDGFDNSLFDRPDLAQFYDRAHVVRYDFNYCAGMAEEAGSVLDLGCGTGELAARLADGRRVAGVDPAAAMLNIARQRPGGGRVEWVQDDARTVRLGARFDLVVLTGHAFQVFLTEDDQQAAIATIAAHLTPEGRFVFDSRNPDFPRPKSQSRENSLHRFQQPGFGEVEMWNISEYDEESGILSYENGYRAVSTGQEFSAPAKIKYTPQPELAAMLKNAGLVVDAWLGDWEGNVFELEAKEIIPVGRLA